MRTHKKSLLLVVLLILVAIATAFVGRTYAKYTGEVSGNGAAVVAKWAFETDNASPTITANITPTADPSTLVNNKIAPGTQGSFAVHVSNDTSETGADFTVKLGTVTSAPTNLKFYKSSTFTAANEITPGTGTITGQLAAGDSTGLDVTIYWQWVYETGTVTNGIAAGDSDDTDDGEAAASLTIPITITGVQTPPSATAITSHIN